ncbi:MAG: ATP-binding cassette domain-containing protein [Deltaproteobacteria bacterium]|jgi:ATP-binding cassette subfamily F protein uup|nr:ATP-binding cassette domain-containing protein [Deltaproteobacteria bacterium]MBW2537340.1 ATP-binding cassette domain-containing protein [Deltaproteobacteria bacterium]
MALVSLRDVSVSFGALPVLDAVSLQLEPGERIGLVGRNGEGKSTLLKLVARELEPDEGSLDIAVGARVGLLPQHVPVGARGSVREAVAGALAPEQRTPDGERAVERTLSRLSLDGDADVAAMSAGMRRRVWLARALAREPDVLLLDEPTNHLDVATIGWLEQQLGRFEGTLLLVTHDRAFLDALSSRIVELDRGRLRSFPGRYADYVRRKQEALADEARERARFDKKLAEEEVWVRGGLKARRTRNEGRVRALERMRAERRQRRERMGSVKMTVAEAERSGKLVIEAKGITVRFGDDSPPVIDGLSTLILRSDRVGIIGPNNCGKTTLLRALAGDLPPSGGHIRLGKRLETAYFDQLKATLDESKSVADNVADGAELLSIGSGRRHVLGYLGDFLFAPERARSPVASLSGGERSRLLLAKLFAKPSNLLVLDEPTNDLDIETLELLEERLLDYSGTVLLVSHDRALLNNVVTSTLVFEGPGLVREYAGGYDDWLEQRAGGPAEKGATGDDDANRSPRSKGRPAKPKTDKRRTLTFKERAELEELPARIEALEAEQQALEAKLGDPAFYREEGAEIARAKQRLERVGQELELAFERWQELEEIATR